jgi:NRAMP (natural resistance-associated macrophage protein)-like metal ion transporter
MDRKSQRRLLIFLSVMGPGIITAMVDNDAGGVATYSITGARYGYSMLWVVFLVTTVLLTMIQEMNVRMGMVTGKGLSALIRERFSLRITTFVMFTLVMANLANTMGEFAGIAASSELFGVSKYLAVPIMAAAIWWITIKGSYSPVEKVLLIGTVIYFVYLPAAVLAKPDWAAVARGSLIPAIEFNAPFITTLIAVIGTSIAPWQQFYQQAAIVDKGLDYDVYKHELTDTIIGCILMALIAGFIVIACGAAFFHNPNVGSIQITDAGQAAAALAPVAGRHASLLFAIGLFLAGTLAGFVVPLSTAYTVCDAFGWESGVNKSFQDAPRFYAIFTSFIALGAGVILIPGIPLVSVLFISQAMNGILLPVILVCMVVIINDRDIMGEHVNRGLFDVVIWLAVLFLVALTVALVWFTIFPAGG